MTKFQPLRVLLVCPMFPPQRGIGPLRTYSFARTWADLGHQVTVLTTCKREDQVGLDLSMHGFTLAEVEHHAPWWVERLRQSSRALPTNPTTEPAKQGRHLKMALRALKARTGIFSAVRQPDTADWWIEPAVCWARANRHWDIVVSSGGPPAAHLVAERVRCNHWAKRWIADFRDLWTTNHIYSGLFPFTLLEHRRERQVLERADHIVTVSTGLAKVLRRRAECPVTVIYNGHEPRDLASLDPAPTFPHDGVVRLVYTGTVYPQGQDVEPVCRALAQVQGAILVVAGENADAWLVAGQRHGISDRIEWRRVLPRAESLRLQRDASALILLDWKYRRHGVLTGKLFEYLASPAPIWVIGGEPGSEAADLVQHTGRGQHCRTTEDVVVALRAMVDGSARPSEPNQHRIAELSRLNQACRLAELFQCVSG